MEIKKIKGINFIKISALVLTIILFIHIILNVIAVYQRYRGSENWALTLLMFILGTIFGLIVRSGLILVFWCSYSIKYPNEKYNQKIAKKIVASFLFLSAMLPIPLSTGMPLVFIICTLVMIIREQKRVST